jgi:hypothetical protein
LKSDHNPGHIHAGSKLSGFPQMADPERRQTVSIVGAAKLLGVGKNQMYRAVERGQVPTIDINNRRHIPLAWIERKLNGDAAA